MGRIYSAKNGRVPDTLTFIRPDWPVAEISLRDRLVNAVLSSRNMTQTSTASQNLIAARSSSGGFQLELIKDAVPGCVLAVTHAEVSNDSHEELDALADNAALVFGKLAKDSCLWSLLQGSMNRGFPHHSIGELSDASFFGKQRIKGEPTCGLPGPKLKNAHSGAVASTVNPGQ